MGKKEEKEARYFQDKATFETPEFGSYCNKNFGEYPKKLSKIGLKFYRVKQENYLRWIEEDKIKLKKPEEIYNPKKQTKFYIKEQPIYYDENGIWWIWDKEEIKWKITDDINILNKIEEITGKDIITPRNRTLILNSLKQECRKSKPKKIKPTWIQFKNKIFDIETEESFDVNPNYFISNPINWELGNSEETPALDILFKQWVGEEHYKELYEILAFCLVPNYFIHRMFCLIGSGANGKSTFLQVLCKFLGEENLTSSSLYLLMTQRFEGSKLLKKLACLMGETNFTQISNTDYLKKLTGEDLVRAEFKGKNCFDFRNYAKLIIATNSLPPTADKTDGFYRRWKIIDFPNKFSKERDVLFNVSDEEYKNLCLKCLNIVKRLYKERTFTNDGDFEKRKKRYEGKSNPLISFIKENYKKDINSEVLFSNFFEELKEFLESRGFRILNSKTVGMQLRNEGYELKSLTRKGINGRFILGIKRRN